MRVYGLTQTNRLSGLIDRIRPNGKSRIIYINFCNPVTNPKYARVQTRPFTEPLCLKSKFRGCLFVLPTHSERVNGWNQLQFGGGCRGTGVRSRWIFEGVLHHPLYGCCAAQTNIAESHTQTALMYNVRQRLMDFLLRLQNSD